MMINHWMLGYPPFRQTHMQKILPTMPSVASPPLPPTAASYLCHP